MANCQNKKLSFRQFEPNRKDELLKINLLHRIKCCLGLLAIIICVVSGCSKKDMELPLPEITISEIWTSGISFTKAGNSQIQMQVSETESFDLLTLDTLISASNIELSNLKSDVTYFYRFRLDDGSNLSDFSTISSFKTIVLPQPVNLSVTKRFGDEIQITWEEIKGVDYDIQIATNNQFEPLLNDFKSIHLATNKRIIDSLTPNTDYFIRIRSKNRNTFSDWVAFEKVRTTNTLRFTLRSLDFLDNGPMPRQLACNNVSPELHWKNIPSGTESLAIIMEDLDFRNGFNHWIIFNIAPSTTKLAQESTGNNRPPGSIEGNNGLGNQIYFGPCPPNGQSHRYVFSLMALNRRLGINGGNIDQFLAASEPHIISTALLTGIYE